MIEDTNPRPWRVWARLTGPFLPEADVRIGNATVGPGPTGYRPSGPPSAPVLTPQDDLTFYTATAPNVYVSSDCWIIVSGVMATNADDAIRQVTQAEIPAVIAALSAGLQKTPHRAQVWGADDGEEGTGVSQVVKITTFRRTNISSAQLDTANVRVAAMSRDSNLSVAAEIFYRAIRYGDFAAGELTSASGILAFYQVLEACSNLVPWERPSDYDTKASEIIAKLQRDLTTKSLIKKRAAAIKTANDALNRLDAVYVGLRIDNAARAFELGQTWIDRARALAKFRNVKLGHANSLPSATEMSEWLRDDQDDMTAFGLASTMLDAALSYNAES